MNDDLEQLEHMLRNAPLRKPHVSLDAKVLRPWRRWVVSRVVIGGVTAAAVLVTAVLLLETPSQPEEMGTHKKVVQTEQSFEPVSLEETMSRVSYEGLITLDGKTPVRMFHRWTIERVWLVDEQSGYSIEMTIPRQQILLVGAEMY